jgi:hypothetical protein
LHRLLSLRNNVPRFPRTAIQYDVFALTGVVVTVTAFHALRFGERSDPDVSSDPGCPLRSEYKPTARILGAL